MKICLSIDMEQDCPPFLSSYRGIEEGTPLFLKLLAEENISATFFTTGDVAERYPEIIRQIVAAGHELASHGHSHRRFDQMNEKEAEAEILKSLEILRKFYPVVSFRAPNLEFPEAYLPLLTKNGIYIDSSTAHYKWTHRKRLKYHQPQGPTAIAVDGEAPTALPMERATQAPLIRFPASMTSSVLRLPFLFRKFFFWKMKKNPSILFVHPWEFVDFTKSNLRLDCRFKTGRAALRCMKENIEYLKSKGFHFLRIKDLMPLDSKVLAS